MNICVGYKLFKTDNDIVYISVHVYWNTLQDLQINMLDCYCSIFISVVFDGYIKKIAGKLQSVKLPFNEKNVVGSCFELIQTRSLWLRHVFYAINNREIVIWINSIIVSSCAWLCKQKSFTLLCIF